MKITEKVGVLSIMLLLLVFIVLVGSSLAFFSPAIEGNNVAKRISLSATGTTIRIKKDQGSSGLDAGDTINIYKAGCYSEDFYVISTNSTKTVLLAKYSLYVGQICTSYDASSCTPISTTASGYGLQSADAKGYVDTYPAVGVVPFAGSSNSYGYWDPSNSGIDTKYGTYTNYENNIYDTDYITAPNYSVAFYNNVGNANYSIAYYVEEYVDRLGIEGTGRLLTYTEANAMTTAQRANGANYWLGSASANYGVRGLNSDGYFRDIIFNYVSSSSVRPVIEINTADIQPAFKRVGTDTTTGLPVVRLSGTNEEFYDITNAINYTNLINANGNIYNYAADESILLAKYNLYVGQICTSSSSSSCTSMSTSASGYGLQSADAKGYTGTYPSVGTVPFSGTYYWSSYTTDQKKNVYNSSLSTTNDWSSNDYSIAYYVEEYVSRLEVEGVGRLLTYTEAEVLNNSVLLNGSSYWLGTNKDDSTVGIYVFGSGGFIDGLTNAPYMYANYLGVRPVVVVSSSYIHAN